MAWTRAITRLRPLWVPIVLLPSLWFSVPQTLAAVTSPDSEHRLLSSESSRVPLRSPSLCGDPETLKAAGCGHHGAHSFVPLPRGALSFVAWRPAPRGSCLFLFGFGFTCRGRAGRGVTPSLLLLLLGQKRSLFLSSCVDVILSQQSACRCVRSLVARAKSCPYPHEGEKSLARPFGCSACFYLQGRERAQRPGQAPSSGAEPEPAPAV